MDAIAWVIGLVVIIMIIVAISKSRKNDTVNLAQDVESAFFYYEKIRNQYLNDRESSVIVLGTPFVEYNGTYVPSVFFAVYVSEEDNSGTTKANGMGMETRMQNNKYVHQFVIKNKYSKKNKIQMLQMLANKIGQEYPNDYLKADFSIPILMSAIDIKDFMEMVQNTT